MFVVGVLIVFFGLLLSVALHELGHLVPAKRFGVRVSQFMVGFGPTLWSRRRGETEYGVKAIPLGGYIRMIGMYAPAPDDRRRRGKFSFLADDARSASTAEVAPGEEGRAFYALSVPKKLVVMLGGPTMNLLIAVVLMVTVVSGFGVARLSNVLGNVASCVRAAPDAECGASDPPAPGAAAGLAEGDVVVSWAGREVSDWDSLVAAIRAGGVEPVEVVVLRTGAERVLTVQPVLTERPVIRDGQVVTDEDGNPVLEPAPFAGVSPQVVLERQSPLVGLTITGEAVAQTAGLIVTLPQQLYEAARDAITGEERDPGVMGLIGLGRAAGELTAGDYGEFTDQARVINLLGLIASLNVALFVFNLLPLLPLDGGHAAGALWEGLRRQVARLRSRPDPGPVDTARAMPLAYAVFFLLIGMTLVLAYADIVNPVTF